MPLDGGIIDLGYRPRPQFVPLHMRRQRWACVVAHRRAGKTVADVMDLIDAGLRCSLTEGRYAYIAPYYAQAKDIAWPYLKRFVRPIPGVVINEGELYVQFPHNAARVRLYGADNYDRMRGVYLDGAVGDEYGDWDPRAFPEVLRPALSDRRGWMIFTGTPKGRNDFHAVHERAKSDPAWLSLVLKASETGLIDAAELADARRMMTPEQYAQEYECSFDAAIMGAYYGALVADGERAGRIRAVPIERELPVHTAWDLGMGDSTSIWMFQIAGQELRVVDHLENHGQPLSWYAAELGARGYAWGDDWVPHDARVRSLETGRTRVETLQALGRNPRLVPDHRLMDGINAVRVSFPRIFIDAERCKFGIEALRQYRTDFDEKTKAFKNQPRHDWTSHAADSFRYMAMAWREIAAPDLTKPKDPYADIGRTPTVGEYIENLLPAEEAW